jgi:CubicO group peptidase (beta-lactamase class C family)
MPKRPTSARRVGHAGLVAAVLVVLAIVGTAAPSDAGSATPEREAILSIARDEMANHALGAVIIRVTEDGKNVVTRALGHSMAGVPATTKMHFRNGAVAISYITTVLLQLVDEHKASLDDKVSRWLPDIPHADQMTLKMLANMTSGYADFEADDQFTADLYQNPFRQWTADERIAIGTDKPLLFDPGTAWGYSHTGIVILGRVLEKITGEPLDVLIERRVLEPLHLHDTTASSTASIPSPVLHALSSERRTALGIPVATPFVEESTYWNPSWTLADGSVETTNVYDLTATADAIGAGTLLSRSSHHAQIDPNLLGFGRTIPGCACFQQSEGYNYGLGVVRSGDWILQNPLFGGYAAVEASLPARHLAIGIAMTFTEQSFDASGNIKNYADDLFRRIATQVAPDHAPPKPKSS